MPEDADEVLGDSDRVKLLHILLKLYRKGRGPFEITNVKLVDLLGKCRDTLQRGLNAIEAVGYILRVKEGRHRRFILGPALDPGRGPVAPTGRRDGADGPAPSN